MGNESSKFDDDLNQGRHEMAAIIEQHESESSQSRSEATGLAWQAAETARLKEEAALAEEAAARREREKKAAEEHARQEEEARKAAEKILKEAEEAKKASERAQKEAEVRQLAEAEKKASEEKARKDAEAAEEARLRIEAQQAAEEKAKQEEAAEQARQEREAAPKTQEEEEFFAQVRAKQAAAREKAQARVDRRAEKQSAKDKRQSARNSPAVETQQNTDGPGPLAVKSPVTLGPKSFEVERARKASAAIGNEDGLLTSEPSTPPSSTSRESSLPLRNGPSYLDAWGARKEKEPRTQSRVDVARDPRRSLSVAESTSTEQAPRSDSKEPENQPAALQKAPVRSQSHSKTASVDSANGLKVASSTLKRPAPASGFEDDRRRSSFKIPKKAREPVSDSASPRSPSASEAAERPPGWYSKMPMPSSRDKNSSNADTLLARLKNQIGKIKKMWPSASGAEISPQLDALRDEIHEAFFLAVSDKMLRKNRMLHNESGLPQLFDAAFAEGVDWPFDIKADAEELYNKWARRDFETDLMRGIDCGKPKSGKGADRSSDSLKSGWPTISARYYGNGELLNGQWWPTQLTCLRDGAHGLSQGGIYGETGKGAYSVIMAGGSDAQGHKYPDKDEGDVVWYCGTDAKPGDNAQPTMYTQRLLESMRMNPKKPVRLIRSHNLNNDLAPSVGFRYDGLYFVESVQRMSLDTQRHRFKLVRAAGQDPIRGGGIPGARPTEQEKKAYDQDKRLHGYGSQKI